MELIRRGTFDHPADFCTWEVEYHDGTTDRESDGSNYAGIDRNNFRSFRLMGPDGQSLFELGVPPVASAHNFVFRRRTSMDNGVRTSVIFVLGFMPMGPAFAIDIANGTYMESDNFHDGDPIFYPPAPMAGESKLMELSMHGTLSNI